MIKPLALAWLMALALASPPAHAEDTEVAATPQARFDARFREIDEDVVLQGPDHARQLLEEMKGLLPVGDAQRERRYRTLVCSLAFDEDAKAGHDYAVAQLAEAEQAKDIEAKARFRFCLAGYLSSQSSPRKALAAYEAGIADARQTDQPLLVAWGIVSRGSVNSLLGNQAAALLDFLEAQRMFERLKRDDYAEDNLFSIAVAYRRMGEFDKAADYLDQYEATVRKRNDEYSLVSVHLQRGFLHEEKLELDAAESAFKAALELSRKHKNRYNLGAARLALASIYVQTGRAEAALTALERANKDFTANHDASNDGILNLYTGQALSLQGKHRAAMPHFDRAEALLVDSGNLRYQKLLYEARSKTHEVMGDTGKALADLRKFVQIQQSLADKTRTEQTQLLRHQFDAQRRDLDNARLKAEKALREQEISALTTARNWQWAAIVLGGVLMVILLALAVRQVLRARRLQVLALTDALTGVANRRRIERLAAEQISEALAQRRPFSVLTLDVDYFKRINDTYGHLAGDQVLVQVAQVCQGALRDLDVIGRTGGEEFLVVLPRAQLGAAAQVAERLRASVEDLTLDEVSPGLKVSISLGVAEFRAEDRDLKELMRRADNALYRAKANGRNRVEIEP